MIAQMLEKKGVRNYLVEFGGEMRVNSAKDIPLYRATFTRVDRMGVFTSILYIKITVITWNGLRYDSPNAGEERGP